MTGPTSPGEVRTLGILGGGQLGRMLAVAASRLGLRTHVYAPEADPVAGHVAAAVTTAPWDDEEALTRFSGSVEVVTYEFENIPVATVDIIEAMCPVRPGRHALLTSQDRLVEKDFLARIGLTTTTYADVTSAADLRTAVETVGVPSILKTRRFGYDGKGQVPLRDSADAEAAWAALGEVPCILERFVDFEREISVIAARSGSGEVVCFDPGENVHRDGILRTTTIPATITTGTRVAAEQAAVAVTGALDYVGVIGIEFFVRPGGDLVAKEMAPRVHNSGHWTQNGCVIDQFEQHVRAVAGLPLGDGRRHSDVVMTNLIGDDVAGVGELARDPSVGIHLYGKAQVRAGRKMGHVNRVTGRPGDPPTATDGSERGRAGRATLAQ